MPDRRTFLASNLVALAAGPSAFAAAWRARAATCRLASPRFGLVTYLWGRDLDLPELLAVCGRSGLDGVELRTTHAHGVEPTLDARGRADVRARFESSPVAFVGIGSDERFDSPDAARLRAAKKATIDFLRLSADLGGGGVKVKPDSFHRGIERAVTIEQIGRSLGELGPVAADLGQEIRLEVHGGCADPRVVRDIVRIADHPAVRVCWNSNPQDLRGLGFQRNYELLRPSFGDTLHVRESDRFDYPTADLLELLGRDGYDGYVLLEAHTTPPVHRVPALRNERAVFDARMRVRPRTPAPGISIAPGRRAPNRLEVRAGDEPFATVHLGGGERTPAIHPLHAPGGRRVLRGFPFERRDGEATDHPHHRGMWFAHGDVNGHDFWHDERCRIRVREHETIDGDTIRFVADWISPDGVLARETRTLRFSATADRRRIDTEIELVPVVDELVFGDTKEGCFALRLAPTLRVEGPRARGRLENAEGLRDGECWGARSSSVTAEGPVDGRLVRVVVVDEESNPWSPSHWHARKYGLLAMNPFGRRAFEGRDAGSGAMTFTPSSPLRCRYATIVETGLRR
ncbi:MAG: DUF6807 family protein [Planctomycetota bacterium]|nr:DUF6807 family protein [Planctomycetota bacterium]MEE2896037.1 DUF6807 family protein [Planctomycetota bacterium]